MNDDFNWWMRPNIACSTHKIYTSKLFLLQISNINKTLKKRKKKKNKSLICCMQCLITLHAILRITKCHNNCIHMKTNQLWNVFHSNWTQRYQDIVSINSNITNDILFHFISFFFLPLLFWLRYSQYSHVPILMTYISSEGVQLV